jgi:hypothetical protein
MATVTRLCGWFRVSGTVICGVAAGQCSAAGWHDTRQGRHAGNLGPELPGCRQGREDKARYEAAFALMQVVRDERAADLVVKVVETRWPGVWSGGRALQGRRSTVIEIKMSASTSLVVPTFDKADGAGSKAVEGVSFWRPMRSPAPRTGFLSPALRTAGKGPGGSTTQTPMTSLIL